VTAQVVNNPQSLWACGEALLSDSAYGALIVPQPVAFDLHRARIPALSTLSQQSGKITCNVLISGWLQGPGTIEAEIDPHVALFRSMDRCFRSIAAWHSRADALARGERRLERRSDPAAAVQAARLIADAPHASLTEHESKAILGLYGIPCVREIRADGPGSAVTAAATLGYPVALKVESPDIAHKTEAGVVALNVGSAGELHQSYERIMANAGSYAPMAAIHGVIVQSMVPSGVELVLGARVDRTLGPLIVVGFGGILVELLKDSAVELAPISPDEALRMLAKLKGYSLLTGFRGGAPVDLERLAEIIVRLSEFVADQQDAVAEVDVNPIICGERSMLAVDALIVRRTPPNFPGAQS
jgi:acyl-CoA synthetase (NDP forming)